MCQRVASLLIVAISLASCGLVRLIRGNDFEHAFEAGEIRGRLRRQIHEDLMMQQLHIAIVGQDDRCRVRIRITGEHVGQKVQFGERPERLIERSEIGPVRCEQYDMAIRRRARLANEAAGIGNFVGNVAVKIDSSHEVK